MPKIHKTAVTKKEDKGTVTSKGQCYLEKRGISIALANKLRIQSLRPQQTLEKVGRRVESLYIPYFSADGTPLLNDHEPFYRLRLLFDDPREQRFGQKKGTGIHAYEPMIGKERETLRSDTSRLLTIIEGEIKTAMAYHVHGIACVGIGGVDCWKVPELESYNLYDRDIELALDSDYSTNPKVRRAAHAMANAFNKRGAKSVRLVRIPTGSEGEKQGIDDFLVRHGRDAYNTLPREDLTLLRQRTYTLPELLDDAIYLSDKDLVTFESNPLISCRKDHLKTLLAASKEKVETPNGVKMRPVAELWLEHPARKTIQVRTFAPGRDFICEDPEGRKAINIWTPLKYEPPTDWQKLVEPLLEHWKFLVPVPEQYEQSVLWAAHGVQKPEELAPWNILMYTNGAQGVGRNLLAANLGAVHGRYAALHVDIAALAGNQYGSGFNDELSSKIFACIDEIHASVFNQGGRRLMENLNRNLTATRRLINCKYGGRWLEHNSLHVLVLSNHVDAIPLGHNDRRFMVIANPNVKKSPEYYSRLYGLLADPAYIASVWKWLMSQDLSKLKLGDPPITAAKTALIESVEPDFFAYARELVAEYPSDVIATTTIKDKLRGGSDLKDYEVRSAMNGAGAIKCKERIRWNGGREYIWALRNPDKWVNATGHALAAELDRGQRATAPKGTVNTSTRRRKF